MALAAKHVPRLTGYCFARRPAGEQRASRLPADTTLSGASREARQQAPSLHPRQLVHENVRRGAPR